MAVYQCGLCSYLYDESTEATKWDDLPDDWVCPICGSAKSEFTTVAAQEPAQAAPDSPPAQDAEAYLKEWRRPADELEAHMADIHSMAITGESIIEPMRTRSRTLGWDEILIMGAQLATIPINDDVPVNAQTVLGPRAEKPLVLETPLYVSHMSFGALSREATVALARGSAAVETAVCSGEGGILPEALENAYKYIFEYVPRKYSVTEEYLKRVDAIEIKIGQSAKPGMGGHLPGDKVTKEIAEIRGVPEGEAALNDPELPRLLCL